jgi:hypothetical protein
MRLLVAATVLAVIFDNADATFMETDVLAATGLAKLGLHVALHGYPN